MPKEVGNQNTIFGSLSKYYYAHFCIRQFVEAVLPFASWNGPMLHNFHWVREVKKLNKLSIFDFLLSVQLFCKKMIKFGLGMFKYSKPNLWSVWDTVQNSCKLQYAAKYFSISTAIHYKRQNIWLHNLLMIIILVCLHIHRTTMFTNRQSAMLNIS